MTQTKDFPRPIEDEDNKPFLAGWREGGRLMLQRSRTGGPLFFYPRPMCPYTWSDDLVWTQASGRGHVVSHCFVHRPNHPAFLDAVPIILAEIELEEGVRLLARILCEDRSLIRSGAPVKTLTMPEAASYALPTFRLAD